MCTHLSVLSSAQLKDPQNTSRQTIIVLLGPTGSGKSTFIEVATCRAQNKTVGHSLQPHTKEIRAITVPHPSTDHPIVLVDTPGLDDTKFDAAIWSMIIVWLRKSYHVSTIAGIVYLYRISDNRSVGSPEKNLPLFDALCGDVKNNVVIATTMWKKVKQSDVGTRRENGWQELLQSGSRIMRFDDTFASAWEIIDNVVKTRIFNPTTSQAASLESRAKSDQLAGRIAELTRPRISYVFPSIQHSVDGFFQRDIDTESSLEAFTRTRLRKLIYLPMFSQKISTGSNGGGLVVMLSCPQYGHRSRLMKPCLSLSIQKTCRRGR
ncbi:hypothetical protein L208DRAFT_362715 [Tricholoma matsutake]|nr:hypothetical protein L208DRAFT_362715 [Tricholoma matsutake 945]